MTKETAPKPSDTTPPGEVHGGWFTPYKEEQGRHVRMAAFWSVVAFLIFGCTYLHELLGQSETLRVPLGGIRIPVVGVDLSPAFIVSFLIFAAGLLLVYRWQQRPRVAELLIDTEAELKKVTWPKGQEVMNSALVVILSVILIGLFLALADAFLARVMRYLILGEQ